MDLLDEDGTGLLAHLEAGLRDGGDGGVSHPGCLHVVHADDGQFFRHPDTETFGGVDGCGGVNIGTGKESMGMEPVFSVCRMEEWASV